MADVRSNHAIIFEIVTNIDNETESAMKMWNKIRKQEMKQGREMKPLHNSIYIILKEVHIIWVTSPQVYDISDLHHVPHYSLSLKKTNALMQVLEHADHISIVEYYTNRNYVSTPDRINVTNIFDNSPLFDEYEVDSILETMTSRKFNRYCTKIRGNKAVSSGLCSQVRVASLTTEDKNYNGIVGCNRPHFTTTLGKMHMDHFFWKCAHELSRYSREYNITNLNDRNRSKHILGTNIYEGITIATLNLTTEEVHPHLDTLNDHREGYNSCTVYSIIRGDIRLSFIGYAKKSAGDFLRRYEIQKNKNSS